MQEDLKHILEIQEYDMQLIQLMRLKKERQKELDNINSVKSDLRHQSLVKESEITELKKHIRLVEGEQQDVVAKLKKLEAQQNSVKKVEEFNALSQEMSTVDRERIAKEQKLGDLYDKVSVEEDLLKNLTQSLDSTNESSKALIAEIMESIRQINIEGRQLKEKRDQLVADANPEIFRIYDRLLRNKKDRVVVPIENRCCSGCHIMLTAQDENLVRKGERLVFCEHCSRIHYWQESEALEGSSVATKTRRRRSTKARA
jgi:uncharacterized protein